MFVPAPSVEGKIEKIQFLRVLNFVAIQIMPQKRWRIDGNFVATSGEFLLQGNATEQTTHCALDPLTNKRIFFGN